MLGNIADFYAGNTNEEIQSSLLQYTEECADKMHKKQWNSDAVSECKNNFQNLVKKYVKNGEYQNKALFQMIGNSSVPGTAVIRDDSALEFFSTQKKYASGDTSIDYSQYRLKNEKNLSFGYWGDKEQLAKIDLGLDSLKKDGDYKSQKFKGIGNANWFEILSTSPAEPGLANIQAIPIRTTREKVLAELQKSPEQRWLGLEYKKNMVSVGGWSDLHPVGVLKASGCDKVVYLTRQDGDAIFAQQIFIRLTGEQDKIPFWKNLKEKNNQGWPAIDAVAVTAWNKMYNLGNLNSSYNRALKLSDAIYCTDWNKFNPFKGENWPMVEDAYSSPVILQNGVAKELQVNPFSDDLAKYPGCSPKLQNRNGENSSDRSTEPAQ